jgi:hypothetical protein
MRSGRSSCISTKPSGQSRRDSGDRRSSSIRLFLPFFFCFPCSPGGRRLISEGHPWLSVGRRGEGLRFWVSSFKDERGQVIKRKIKKPGVIKVRCDGEAKVSFEFK